jgi:hypothetical protein
MDPDFLISGVERESVFEKTAVNVSSRTPEGWPHRCPICGADVRIEPSMPPGDAPCPWCGTLLWFRIETSYDVSVPAKREPPTAAQIVAAFFRSASLGEMLGALEAEDRQARLYMAEEMMLFGLESQSFVTGLAALLKSNDPELRRRAAAALWRLES